MILKCLPTGMMSSNCYILGDGGEGAVIDPGVETSEIARALEAAGLALKYIILTHVHLDHILYMDELRKLCGAPVLAHVLDAASLGDPVGNGSALFRLNKVFEAADICLKDGDVYTVGQQKLEIMHTPGHTPGSICIKAGESLFTGDTLFRQSIGRTDFKGGSMEDMRASLKKLMELEDGIISYPGHGPSTTIGYERRRNSYVQGFI